MLRTVEECSKERTRTESECSAFLKFQIHKNDQLIGEDKFFSTRNEVIAGYSLTEDDEQNLLSIIYVFQRP